MAATSRRIAWPTRDDGIAGDLFRLGEPHGDARHRLGDDAHLLRAPHHVGQHVEEQDRRQHEAGEADHGRDAGRALLQHRLQIGQIEERQHHAARRPGDREHGRDDVGGLGRALLQAVQDLADRLAVVIGGELARPHVVGGRGAATLEQVLLGRRRSDRVARCGGWARRWRRLRGCGVLIAGARSSIGLVGCAQDLLDGRQGLVRRVRQLLRVVRHVGRRLTRYSGTSDQDLSLNELPLQAGPPRDRRSSPQLGLRQPGRAAFSTKMSTGPLGFPQNCPQDACQLDSNPIGLGHQRKRRR